MAGKAPGGDKGERAPARSRARLYCSPERCEHNARRYGNRQAYKECVTARAAGYFAVTDEAGPKVADAEATREVCRELETAVGLLSKADPDPEMWPEGRQPHKRERTFIDLATASDVEWPTVHAALKTHFGSTHESRTAAIDFGYFGFRLVLAVLQKTTGIDDPFCAQAANLWMAQLRGDVLCAWLSLALRRQSFTEVSSCSAKLLQAPVRAVRSGPVLQAVQPAVPATPRSLTHSQPSLLGPQSGLGATFSSEIAAAPFKSAPTASWLGDQSAQLSIDWQGFYADTHKDDYPGANGWDDANGPDSIDPARRFSPPMSDRSRSTAPSVQPNAKPESVPSGALAQSVAANRAPTRSSTPRVSASRVTRQTAKEPASGIALSRRSGRTATAGRQVIYAESESSEAGETPGSADDEDDGDSTFALNGNSDDSAGAPSSTTSLSSAVSARRKAVFQTGEVSLTQYSSHCLELH